jgi:hypothetical protein
MKDAFFSRALPAFALAAVALAGFDSRYFGLVPFTTDRRPIMGAFDDLAPFGSTALHDALDKAAQDLASHGEGRRAVIVVTDGVDTSSWLRADAVLDTAKRADVVVYGVSVVSRLKPESFGTLILVVGQSGVSQALVCRGALRQTKVWRTVSSKLTQSLDLPWGALQPNIFYRVAK